jgi:hypothetical protein
VSAFATVHAAQRGPVVPPNLGGPHFRRTGLAPRRAAMPRGPCETAILSPTLWRIDNKTFANDAVHRLSVDVGPNHFKFELVICGIASRLA